MNEGGARSAEKNAMQALLFAFFLFLVIWISPKCEEPVDPSTVPLASVEKTLSDKFAVKCDVVSLHYIAKDSSEIIVRVRSKPAPPRDRELIHRFYKDNYGAMWFGLSSRERESREFRRFWGMVAR